MSNMLIIVGNEWTDRLGKKHQYLKGRILKTRVEPKELLDEVEERGYTYYEEGILIDPQFYKVVSDTLYIRRIGRKQV